MRWLDQVSWFGATMAVRLYTIATETTRRHKWGRSATPRPAVAAERPAGPTEAALIHSTRRPAVVVTTGEAVIAVGGEILSLFSNQSRRNRKYGLMKTRDGSATQAADLRG